MWWLNGNIVEAITGLRRLRGLVAAENERIASLLRSIDSASSRGTRLAVATVAAADGPRSSGGSDPGMAQQAISQHGGKVVVASTPLPLAHVRAGGTPPKGTMEYDNMAMLVTCPTRHRSRRSSAGKKSETRMTPPQQAISQHGPGTMKYEKVAKLVEGPDCGSIIRKSNRSYHVATTKHLQAVAARHTIGFSGKGGLYSD